MPQRRKAARRNSSDQTTTVLPIRCASCGTWSWMTLPGPAPWPGAVFKDKGWSVLNEPVDGHVLFACQGCFEREMNSSGSKIHGEG